MVSIETVAAGMGFSHDLALALEQACIRFGINTELRVCHFLAQVAHESGTGRWLRELWGRLRLSRVTKAERTWATARAEMDFAFAVAARFS